MPFPMNPRTNPPRTTHRDVPDLSYNMLQHTGNENVSEGRGQDSGNVPPKHLTDRTQDSQQNGCRREDPDILRFQRPYKDVPVLNRAHDESREYATNNNQTARQTNHLADAVSDDEVKRIDRLQSKAFGGHDPNSVIRVGNEMFTTPQEMVQIGKLLCKICFANDAAIVFLPCSHLVCCPVCDARNTIDKCCLCKEIIGQRIRVQDEERDTGHLMF
ncbi:E3 ubiquitin-protein ligase cblA-like isoform X2 [Mizuhopecten yessoensis]|uniref:E3 ubiquitin-protein ligase XIAP n=1 Tax=Mizuhopecten yessoensis TaxID=6573 RepID=A0A210Q6L6_MIZYE|nr:E3 ubiquitin-protein ligase cblA-like isoform X2 [Mizuhopecten yessoensis]OWF44361.1 E3 ubiquitin-protein ligase XIAP [Mizuhopecten yessoensis]